MKYAGPWFERTFLLNRQQIILMFVIPAPHQVRDKLQPESRKDLDAPGVELAGAGLSSPA